MRRPQGKLTNARVSIDDARADQNGATLKQLYQDSDMPDSIQNAHHALDAIVDRAFGAKTTCANADERKRILIAPYVELTSRDQLPMPRKAKARR